MSSYAGVGSWVSSHVPVSSHTGVESWVSSRGDRQEARSVHPFGVESPADVDGPRFEGRGLSGWENR